MKIPRQLQSLIEMGAIDDVIRPLMSGKEAQVFVVSYHSEICVAKVYKEVENRSFRQRSVYAEGRKSRNGRDQRAMDKMSRYGRALQEEHWKNSEVDMLYRLHAAGVRVPEPRDFLEGVLIMNMVRDGQSHPAPRLAELDLSDSPENTFKIFYMIIRQIVLMLCSGVVHGDLSEYNILLAPDGPVIIDFPQAIYASVNQNAKNLFIRDVQNLTNVIARDLPKLKGTQFGQEIWELYENSKLRPDSVLTGYWRDSRRNANVSSILAEIENARLENLKKQKS